MYDRWKKLLGEATNAVEVVTFDYPCKMLLLYNYSVSSKLFFAECRVQMDPLIRPLYSYVEDVPSREQSLR